MRRVLLPTLVLIVTATPVVAVVIEPTFGVTLSPLLGTQTSGMAFVAHTPDMSKWIELLSYGLNGGTAAVVKMEINSTGNPFVSYEEFTITYGGDVYEPLTNPSTDTPPAVYFPDLMIGNDTIAWVFTSLSGPPLLVVINTSSPQRVVHACEVQPPGTDWTIIPIYDEGRGYHVIVYLPSTSLTNQTVTIYDPSTGACYNVDIQITYDNNTFLGAGRIGAVFLDSNLNPYTYFMIDDTNYSTHHVLVDSSGLHDVTDLFIVMRPRLFVDGSLVMFDGLSIVTLSPTSVEVYEPTDILRTPNPVSIRGNGTGLTAFTIQQTNGGTYLYRFYVPYDFSKMVVEKSMLQTTYGTSVGTIKGSLAYGLSPVAEIIMMYESSDVYVMAPAWVASSNTTSYTYAAPTTYTPNTPAGINVVVSVNTAPDVSPSITYTPVTTALPDDIKFVVNVVHVRYEYAGECMTIKPYAMTFSPTSTIKGLGRFRTFIRPAGLGTVIDPSQLTNEEALTEYRVCPAQSVDIYYTNITEMNISVVTTPNGTIVATEPGVLVTAVKQNGSTLEIDLNQKGYVMIAAPDGAIQKIEVVNGTQTTTICDSAPACDALKDTDGVIVVDPAIVYITESSGDTGTSAGEQGAGASLGGSSTADWVRASLAIAMAVAALIGVAAYITEKLT